MRVSVWRHFVINIMSQRKVQCRGGEWGVYGGWGGIGMKTLKSEPCGTLSGGIRFARIVRAAAAPAPNLST